MEGLKYTDMELLEYPIENFQNKEAQDNWGDFSENQCALCGKKVGKSPKWLHYTTNGTIVNSSDETKVPHSQGAFPVGVECAKKLPKGFVFSE